MKLNWRIYKKGEKIVGTYLNEIAGDNLQIATAWGISADIFDKGKYYQCPNVVSENKGSGKFLDFLKLLKKTLDKPIYFCAVVNQRIYKYLEKADIGVVVYKGETPQFYKVKIN